MWWLLSDSDKYLEGLKIFKYPFWIVILTSKMDTLPTV